VATINFGSARLEVKFIVKILPEDSESRAEIGSSLQGGLMFFFSVDMLILGACQNLGN